MGAGTKRESHGRLLADDYSRSTPWTDCGSSFGDQYYLALGASSRCQGNQILLHHANQKQTTGILLATALTLDLLFVSETHADTLLTDKARRLRVSTGNWAIHAKCEERNPGLSDLAHRHLMRPFRLLVTPICAFMTLYASFVYGILYLAFAAFPIEFTEIRGWNLLVGSLPFLAILIGVIIANIFTLGNQRFYIAKMKANGGRPVPEARLPPMMLGGPVLAAGLFIFGWTSGQGIHWIVYVPC